ncbi:MAG: aminoacyl-tRNA hydrolase [Acidimicrobiales bacterium]
MAVGLGNPGSRYQGTRHNLGADTVALLACRHGGSLRRSPERALADEVILGGCRLALAFPQTFMNLSGESVRMLARRYGVEGQPQRLVVLHDELDLPSGVVRVKEGGGTAGHNGLRSIQAHLGTNGFLRVRIGIGKAGGAEASSAARSMDGPAGRSEGGQIGHVLRRPSSRERKDLDVAVELAADAVECILSDGVAAAMNRFNARSRPGH